MSEKRNTTDMELMHKLMRFTRKAQKMTGRHHGPHMRPPMPEEGHDPMERRHPDHCRRPPMSREHLLVMISRHPEGIHQKDIAEKANINQSSASELITKLEGDGYVVRKIDPEDKRATLLYLTELGEARAAEVEDERNEAVQDVFKYLNEEEKQTLSDLLDKLLQKEE